MPRALSLYLDLTRFFAALVVVLSHLWLVFWPSHPLHWPGPAAVIVFFVLSGIVIAHVTDGRDRTLTDYTLNRLSRLWSVALPALAFGMLLFPFVRHSDFLSEPANSGIWLRSAANVVFLGQVWFFNVAPPLNGPYWSLNYEAWFYAIFGAWIYIPRPAKVLATCILAALAGPKILLLMPCWLIGVLVYRSIGRWELSQKTATILWTGTLGAALLLVKSTVGHHLHEVFQARWPDAANLLAYSGYLLTDYLLALLIAGNFYAAAYARWFDRILVPLARPIRMMASCTLTTYLFHLPLLILLWDMLQFPAWMCVVALAASIMVIGILTEYRRRELRALLKFMAFQCHSAWRSVIGKALKPAISVEKIRHDVSD